MKIKTILILMASILLFCGCAHTMKMAAIATPEQQVGYQETIISQKKHFVSLAPYREYNPSDNRTSFVLFVKNCGERPIDISNNNISVMFEGRKMEWVSRRVNILSYDDLMSELKRKSNSEELVAISSRETVYNYSYGSDGNIIAVWTSTVMVPAGAVALAALRELNEQMDFVEKLVMKSQTLQPEESGGGLVVCDTSDMNSETEGNFKVAVSVNGEEHEFTFNRSLYK